MVRTVTLLDLYLEHFDSYTELVGGASTPFHDPTAPAPSICVKTISPELLWYMGCHPDKDGEPNGATDWSHDLSSTPPTINSA